MFENQQYPSPGTTGMNHSLYSLMRFYVGYYRRRRYFFPITVSITTMVLTLLISFATPYIPKYAIDHILATKDFEKLWYLFAAALGGTILREACKYYYSTRLMTVRENVSLEIQQELLWSVYSRSYSYLDAHPAGYLLSRITSDVNRLGSLSLENLLNLFFTLVFVVVAIVLLTMIDPFLTVLAMVCVALGGGIAWWPNRSIKAGALINSENWARVQGKLQEKLMSIRVTKILNSERRETAALSSLIGKAIDFSIGYSKRIQLYTRTIIVTASLSLVVTLLFAFLEVMKGTMSLGTCLSFFMYTQLIYSLTTYLYVEYTNIRSALGPLERVFEMRGTSLPFIDAPAPAGLLEPPPTAELGVMFNNVTFGYDNGKAVLDRLTFEVAPGEQVAIVGESGSGKSTIGKLIIGMYEPWAGRVILHNGHAGPLPEGSPSHVAGIVMQDDVLFGGSIIENITYGMPAASIDEVVTITRALQMHDFIMSLPGQYQADIRELGRDLSGGQRQRLCIARALLRRNALYVFDEITSTLDKGTEQAVVRALAMFYPRVTKIYITHSSAILHEVDRVFYLAYGRVLASGPHAELLVTSERYRDFHKNTNLPVRKTHARI